MGSLIEVRTFCGILECLSGIAPRARRTCARRAAASSAAPRSLSANSTSGDSTAVFARAVATACTDRTPGSFALSCKSTTCHRMVNKTNERFGPNCNTHTISRETRLNTTHTFATRKMLTHWRTMPSIIFPSFQDTHNQRLECIGRGIC